MNVGVFLIVAIVSAAIGYFAGIILTNLQKDRSNESTGSETPEINDPGPRFEADHLTMALWSKTPDGPLFADIDGKSINSSTELSPEERYRVDKALNDFQMWLGRPILSSGKTGTLPPITNNGALAQAEQPSPTNVSIEANGALTEAIAQESGEVQVAEMPETIPPPVEIVKPVNNETYPEVKPVPPVISFRSTSKPPAPTPKSIVEQINDILQEKVKKSPLAEVGIVLQETPKGVIVWIGNDSYHGVDTLPEGDAKKIIREAVAEWEKK